ncbi:L-arabinose ABC transporter permease AraH [Deltaproteobacteria bacterium Smac51]|nr:L-arabinose ABC transporter permease AraH [Deltaproteobacteria bacterium Smac51]
MSTVPQTPPAPPGRDEAKGFDYSIIWDKYGMLLVFILLFAACSAFIPNFFSWINMKVLGMSVSVVGMVACGMVFCLVCADLDLSVGAVVACAGVVTAWVLRETDSIFLGVMGGLCCGLFFGLLNGFFISVMKNNALIVTLATQQIARGAAYTICGGVPIGILNEHFYMLGDSDLMGIPTPIILTAVCFIIFGFLLSNTVFGRNSLALGGNAEASRLAGVNVIKTKMLIFALTGLVSAFAGIVLTSRLTSGQPMNGLGLELNAISACVLGGVSLTGGIGKMSTVVAGVLILGTVENAMNLLNISTFTQYIVRGAILLAAINLDQYKQKLRRG